MTNLPRVWRLGLDRRPIIDSPQHAVQAHWVEQKESAMSAVARIGLVLFVLGMVAALQPSSSATAATAIVTIGSSRGRRPVFILQFSPAMPN